MAYLSRCFCPIKLMVTCLISRTCITLSDRTFLFNIITFIPLAIKRYMQLQKDLGVHLTLPEVTS